MVRNLWAPWRMAYLREAVQKGRRRPACFLCRAPRPGGDGDGLVLSRGRAAFAILNLYPYNNGHFLVAPYRHVPDLSGLADREVVEIMRLAERLAGRLRRRLKPHGFNLGFNFGAAAGAGVPGHLHLHVVPRWAGDTNFMPVLADTKVISQSLAEIRRILLDPPRGRRRGRR